jgi:dynein intermediate chain
MQGRPELTLNCQYEITKAMFNPHNPNIVIASTMAGYLLEWDIRAKKEPISGPTTERKNRSQPIQKSCLAKDGHQYPVYCMSVIGFHNQHNIVSISNDGKMCNWRPTALLDPQSFTFLSVAKETQNAATTAPDQPPIGGAGDNRQPVYAHCLDFTEGEQDYFYVGSEDFKIYQC